MKKSRQEILAEVLYDCYLAMTRGESQAYSASDDTETFYVITPQEMAQWDFSHEDWNNMDFWLLADETMRNLDIDFF